MQLSILMPTNRHDRATFARIVQATSWAGPKIEVIIRDNSGNPAKRALLERLETSNCSLVFAEPCSAEANFSETMRLAKGEFSLFVADDDHVCDHAIRMLPDKIDEVRGDKSVAALTGRYVMEGEKTSTPMAFPNTNSEDILTRIAGFVNFIPPNLLFYSVIRTKLIRSIFSFVDTLPFFFSYHDNIISLLYLMNGRFVDINRLFYLYTMGDWGKRDTQQKRDLFFYERAKMDPAINVIQWLICGFEGSMLIRHASLFPAYPPSQREFLANIWFSAMRNVSANDIRFGFGSAFVEQAQVFRKKWLNPGQKISLEEMLGDLCAFMDLFSKENSQKYFKYWTSIQLGNTALSKAQT